MYFTAKKKGIIRKSPDTLKPYETRYHLTFKRMLVSVNVVSKVKLEEPTPGPQSVLQ